MFNLIMIFYMIAFTSNCFAGSEEYYELYETYAASSAAKYHDVIQSLDSGDLDKAKEKLLNYQAAEIMVLERLARERGVRDSSSKIIEKTKEYNRQIVRE